MTALVFVLVFCYFARCNCQNFKCAAHRDNCEYNKRETSPEFSPYAEQGLIHCKPQSTEKACLAYRLPASTLYSMNLREHYEKMMTYPNHSFHRVNENMPWQPGVARIHLTDILLDARCIHSWPFNPYHRIADCLLFLLPAIERYLETGEFSEETKIRRRFLMLVDESTEAICDQRGFKKGDKRFDDKCMLSSVQSVFRSRFYFQCMRVSMFPASTSWFRTKNFYSVQTKEFIWFRHQKDPLTFGSGFHNVKHPFYSDFIEEFRRIYFRGFCDNCEFSTGSSVYPVLEECRSKGFGEHLRQDSILLLYRYSRLGRTILQNKELEEGLELAIRGMNLHTNSSSGKWDDAHKSQWKLTKYGGYESRCETIAKFWSARVIIAAHGAGIVNTIFSRTNALLIEITPDRLEPELRGQPWRTNTPFARSVGLSTHVIVIPHNESATTEADIQRKYAMSLEQRHIDKVVEIMKMFLEGESRELSEMSVMM